MKSLRIGWSILAVAFFMLAFSSLAHAQATRTWVSGVGDDANPCSRTAPCKTWAGAISKTADGGEIDALDPGGFGALTITKSITLDGGGGQVASTLATGTNGIVIAGNANTVVSLRNLRLNGVLPNGTGNPQGSNGIVFSAGKFLHIENTVIFGWSGACVQATGAGQISIENSTLEDCPIGVDQNGTAGSNIFVVGCRFEKNSTALRSGSSAGTMSLIGVTLSSFSDTTTVIYNTNGGQIFTGNDNSHFNEALVGASTGGIGKI